MKITVINQEEKINTRKRVAAYARVSTLSCEQEESFESQVDYYTQLIGNNKNYVFVEVYADNGISGTQTTTRPNFMRMINDAMNGLIDIIYCKSISRFCRNSALCQETIHMLREKQVEVRFEKENLSSFDSRSEMVFNFLSIIAQEESRSISENIIWTLDRLAEKGIRRLGNNRVFGYSEINGVLTPNECAPAVKMIFDYYAQGRPLKQIITCLDSMGYTGLRSKQSFSCSSISSMITNVIYKGDRIIQKKPHYNYLTKKPCIIKDFKSYYVEDAHEAIVSKELFNECQKEKERRSLTRMHTAKS